MYLKTTYQSFIDYKNDVDVEIHFLETDNRYDLFLVNGGFHLNTTVDKTDPKNADQIDFENNYQADANVRDANQLEGATDNTRIGNTKDRMKVESLSSFGTNLYYDDFNTSSGGISRGTTVGNTWTRVYDSTLAPTPGTSGLVSGLILNLEKLDEGKSSKSWCIRIVVDGVELFGANGIKSSDLISSQVYGYDVDVNKSVPEWLGLSLRESTFRWEGPVNSQIRYEQGVQVYIKKLSDSKKFRAGIITITKD